jgi:hypothetical protein
MSPLRRCRSIATACSANSFHCFAKSKYICLMSGPGAARAAHWHSTAFLRQASPFAVAHSLHSVAFANELNRPCPPAPVCLTQCPVPSESDRSTAPRKMTRCANRRPLPYFAATRIVDIAFKPFVDVVSNLPISRTQAMKRSASGLNVRFLIVISPTEIHCV